MEYPKRKHPRLKEYDYSLPGYYYITVHTEQGAPLLSRIRSGSVVKRPAVVLTEYGKIVQEQLLALEERYANVKIDKYVVMPTHIHAILRLTEQAAGASPRPTVPEVIGTFKSLATRLCNQRFGTSGKKLFQASFYEKVLRTEKAYQECWLYIDGNPDKWLLNPEDL